jgi:hypothetical protein
MLLAQNVRTLSRVSFGLSLCFFEKGNPVLGMGKNTGCCRNTNLETRGKAFEGLHPNTQTQAVQHRQ